MSTRQNLRILDTNERRLARAQARVGSQIALTKPSDSAEATALALRTRARINMLVNKSDPGDATDQLEGLDISLGSIQSMVSTLKELAIRGSDGITSSADLLALGTEASMTAEDILKEANVQTGGRYLYSGDAPWVKPFVDETPGAPAYKGNSSPMEIEVGIDKSVRVGLVGSNVFMDATAYGGKDLFKLASDLAAAFTTGDTQVMSDSIDALSKAGDHIGMYRVAAGAASARLNEGDGLQATLLRAQDALGGLEEVDFAEAASELVAHETIYQAALSVTARVAQRRTLVDLLR